MRLVVGEIHRSYIQLSTFSLLVGDEIELYLGSFLNSLLVDFQNFQGWFFYEQEPHWDFFVESSLHL